MGPRRLAFTLLQRLTLAPAARRLRAMGPGEALRTLVFALIGLFFIATIYSIFKPLTAFLWQQEELGPVLSARFLTLLFSLLFLLIAFSSLLAFLNRLLFAEDAPLFAATPLAPSAYFELRLAQATLGSTWMLGLLWLPYLWALRKAVSASWAWLFWAALAPWPLAILASALSAGLVCLLVSRLSPQRLRQGLFGLAVFVGLGALLALRFSRPERLADPETAKTVSAYLASLQGLEPWWWPPSWASKAVWLALNRPGQALAWFMLSLVTGVGAWVGVVRIFGDRALDLWWRGLDSNLGKARHGAGGYGSLERRPFWRILLQRELQHLVREPGMRLQALLLGVLVSLFVFSLWRLPLQDDEGLKAYLYLPVGALGHIVLVAVAARFILPNASIQRPGSWLLHSAPLGPWQHILPKFLLYGSILQALGLLLWLATAKVLNPLPALALLGLAQSVALPWALAGLHLGLGTAWARDGVKQAEDVISSSTGVLVMVLSFLLILGANGLAATALRQAWILRYARSQAQFLAWSIGACAVLWMALVLVSGIWPMVMGKRRIAGEDPRGA